LSKVVNEGIVGGRYHLVRAEELDANSTEVIDIVEDNRGQSGARITIEPNSLVDHHGRPPVGLLRVFLSTIDQRDPVGRLPGDYAALTVTGREVALASLGAIYLDVKDQAGHSYSLLPGRTALLWIPIAKAQSPLADTARAAIDDTLNHSLQVGMPAIEDG